MSKMWRELVPDRYVKISNLLKADIAAPIAPEVMMKGAKNLSSVIAAGKTGHGTSTCQRCGEEPAVRLKLSFLADLKSIMTI